MMGKVLTGNSITAYGSGATTLIGTVELSEGERDTLLQLCRQRLDGVQVEDGNPQRREVAKERTAIRS